MNDDYYNDHFHIPYLPREYHLKCEGEKKMSVSNNEYIRFKIQN